MLAIYACHRVRRLCRLLQTTCYLSTGLHTSSIIWYSSLKSSHFKSHCAQLQSLLPRPSLTTLIVYHIRPTTTSLPHHHLHSEIHFTTFHCHSQTQHRILQHTVPTLSLPPLAIRTTSFLLVITTIIPMASTIPSTLIILPKSTLLSHMCTTLVRRSLSCTHQWSLWSFPRNLKPFILARGAVALTHDFTENFSIARVPIKLICLELGPTTADEVGFGGTFSTAALPALARP